MFGGRRAGWPDAREAVISASEPAAAVWSISRRETRRAIV
jgi:hypothetical protein